MSSLLNASRVTGRSIWGYGSRVASRTRPGDPAVTGGRFEKVKLDRSNASLPQDRTSLAIGLVGLSYASVPLYRAFCQVTGMGGTTQASISGVEFKTPTASTSIVADAKPLYVSFNSDVSSALNWSFIPLQRAVEIRPGETTLAFYKAKNNTDETITGVATYNVQPSKAGVYFNKIQCFCFEEQQLRPYEEVDMPVFFFIDPEIIDDPWMRDVDEIVLSYTFFRTKDVEL